MKFAQAGSPTIDEVVVQRHDGVKLARNDYGYRSTAEDVARGHSLAGRRVTTVPRGAATTVFAAVTPALDAHAGIYLSDCNEESPSLTALDSALAEQVWALSKEAVA